MWNSLYFILIFFLVCYITKQDIKQGLVLSSSFVFSFFALWLILQQNIENILPYLIGGFELTNGYTEAMTNPGPIWLIFVGGISVLYVLIIGTYFFIYKKEEIEIFFILNAFILFSAFKSGFVRQGDIHILAFLGVFLLFLGILLVILINELKTTQSKKFIAFCIFLSLVIIGGLTASIYIISPWVLQANIVDQSPSNEFSFKILNNPILFDDIVTSQKEKIKKLLDDEALLDTDEPFSRLRNRILTHRDDVRGFFSMMNAAGKKVYGYGASTKGNIVLNYCGLGTADLAAIGDLNPEKDGLVTPGTRIPIISHEKLRKLNPEYLFVLIWHFRKEVIRDEIPLLKNGCKMVFDLPRLHIVDAANYERYLDRSFEDLAYSL